MKRTFYAIIAATMIALMMPASVFAQGPPVTLTGHVATDFPGGTAILVDPTSGTNPPGYDVGMPPGWPLNQYPSGWDIEHIAFFYDGVADTMYVGFNYFDAGDTIDVFPPVAYNTLTADVVAGDPDNDLDPSNTSPALASSSGQDVPNLGDGESVLLVVDTNLDNVGDVIVGVPQVGDVSNFQIAAFTDGSDLSTPTDAFGAPITSSPATLGGNPSASYPDFEFTIQNVSQLPNVQFDPATDCTLDAQYFVFNGSIADGGIGEDFIPGVNQWVQFSFDAVRPELAVTKDLLTTDPIGVGDTVVYHITIENTGCSDLTIVPFEDTFDSAYLQFQSSTVGAGPDTTSAGAVGWNDLTTTLGDIAVGGSIEFDVTFQALDGTPVGGFTTNTGTSEGAKDGNGNGAPTDGDGADTVIYEPGIGVVKTAGTAADGATFYVDGNALPANVAFHYQVTNTGNTHLTGMTIVDDRGTPGDTSDDVTIDSSQCSALAGPLAPGGSLTCDVTLAVDNPFPVTNIGVATGTPSDGGGAPLSGIDKPTADDDAVVDKGSPGISIVKLAGNAADGTTLNIPQVGLVTYQYTVKNEGDTYLSDITIVDDHGTPSTPGDDITINATECAGLAGPLAPQGTVVCTKDIQVDNDTTNVATASGNPTDSQSGDLPGLDNPTGNDDAIVDVFLPSIDLQKTVYLGHDGGASCASAVETVSAGQGVDITYCFVVTNTGDTYLDDVTVTDATLGNITLDKNNGLVSGAFPLAPNNGQATFYYETTLAQDLINTASATGNPTESDGTDLPGYTNPTADDTAEVMALYLTLGNRVFRDEGAGANFNNAVQDGDEGGLAGVQLRLLNSDGTEYDTDPNTAGVQPYDVTTDGDGYYSFDGLSVGSYKVRVLAANFSGVLAGYASSTDIGSSATPDNDTDQDDNGIGAAASGDVDSGVITLDYNAEPTGEEIAGGTDNDAYTNFTLDFGFWLQRFDLALRKTPVSGSATPGSNVTYQITVFNQGTLDATNIGITDYIPNGMTYSSSNAASVTLTAGGAAVSISDQGDGTFTIDALPLRDSVTFEITLHLSDTFQDASITNWAEIDSASGGTDADSTPDSSNQNTAGEATAEVVDDDIDSTDGGRGDSQVVDEDDHDLATVEVGQTFDLALRKQPAPGQNVSPGGQVTFIITVFNQGTLNATNIGVTDYIPANTSYQSSNVATVTTTDQGASVSISDDGAGTFTIDTLAGADSVSFNVTLDVSVNFQGASLTNWAEIDSATGGTDVDSTPDNANQNTPGEQSGEIVDDDIDSTDGGQGNPGIVDEDDHDVATIAANQFDWGDLPDPSYLTTRTQNGPRHIIVSGVQLGATVDTETDGQPNATASGDDAVGDDEDGVRFLTPLMPNTTATIEVDASIAGFLNAWIDWNNDGFLNSSDEYVFQELPLVPGTNSLQVAVPAAADATSLYSRFRFTTGEDQATTPTGEAPNGEVEDYVLMSLGDTVWRDNGTGGGVPNNGVQDGGEPGVPGVTVELLQGGSVVATTETDADGNYLFMGLNPGDYTVHISASNFASGGPLAGLISSTGAGDPNLDIDQDTDENGVDDNAPATNGISSSTVTLALGQAPTSEDNDANSNLTVDFSFVRFDLALTKKVQSLSQTPLVPGASTVTFEIEVINQGDVAASNVEVIDYVQSGFTYDQNANAGWSAGPNPTITIPGPIPAGGSETVTIVLGVADGTSGLTLANFAEISNDGQPPNTDSDSTPDANNQESPVKDDIIDEDAKANPGVDDEDDHDIATTGVAVFDLALRKTVSYAPDPIIAGESKITFQIEVFNQGDATAYQIQITDYVPAGFTYDPADNPAWTQAQTTTPQTTINSLSAATGSAKVNIVLSVDADVAAQSLVNGAEISAADNNENPNDAPPVDKDSTPNTNPGDDNFVDDEINDDGTNDEDDADKATVDVPGVNLGNVVWNDANDNGVLDIGEDGIEGVTLQLFREGQNPATEQPIDTAVTNGDGEYSFEGLPPGNYFVYIPTPPASYPASSTATDMDDNGQDNDDNGDQPSIGSPTTSPVITLRPGTEPENDGDGSNGDLTLDFGFFAPVNIGNLVWHDANGNGLVDAGEHGIPAVAVELYEATQTPGVDTPIRTTQTDGAGAYGFENLSPGEYIVYIPQAPGLYPVSSAPTDENDNGQDNDDNGIQAYPGGPIASPVIELTAGAEPDTPDDGDDVNGDLTVDFGFHAPVSLGNLVWHDVNNNGLVDNGEQGIPGITVQLYAAGDTPGVDAPVAVEVTNNDGVYKFIDLFPGDYFVYIAEPPANYPTSSTNTDEADNGEDNDDNGIQPVGSGPVTSPVVTLISNGEPINDGDGPNSDLTMDFGFYRFDLALRKTVTNLSDAPLVPGQSTVTFGIEVINQGDTPVSNVEVIDYVQAGFVYDPNANPGWSAGPNPTTVVPGPIDPGQSATVQIVLGVGAGTSGSTLENFAEISNDGQLPGTDIDSTPDATNQESPVKDDVIDEDGKGNPGVDDEDDHDSATIGVELFDLALRKRVATVSETPLIPGQSKVTFSIEVFNQGDTPAHDVTVIDYVPTGFLYDPADNPGWSGDPNPTRVIPGPIDPGQSTLVQIRLMVAPGVQGMTLENAAEIMSDGTQGADVDSTPDGANTEQPVKDDVINEDAKDNPGVDDEDDHDIAPVEIGAFDLALRKLALEDDNAYIAVGDDVPFTIQVFNQGDIAAYNVAVVDYLPTGLSLSENDDNGWTAVGANVQTVLPGPINPGESVTVEIILHAGDDTGAMVNEAEILHAADVNGNLRDDVDSTPDAIQGNDIQVDDVIDNSQDDEDDNDIAEIVVDRFDLALEKTLADGQPTDVAVGGDVEFTITIFNQGTMTATQVSVVDYIPAGLTLSPQDANGWTVVGDHVENVIAGPIPPGGSASVNILLVIGEDASGSIHNTAEISGALDENGISHQDTDSTADTNPNNDPVVDDEINNDGTVDEDDSDVAIIDVTGPTAITLASFAAVANDSGVSLLWRTTMELDTLGYHIYRSTGCSLTSAARITTQPIVSQGIAGGSYRYDDGAVLGGVTYCYWLDEVEMDGNETIYGPVQASVYGSNVRTPLFLPIIHNK